jgi:MFS family permease
MSTPAALSVRQRAAVLFVAFSGLVGAGFQLGLMPLASLSISRDLLGEAYAPGLAGDWFARFTAAIMLGGAIGGIFLGSLGDRIGRARTTGISILILSLAGAAGAFVTTQEQLLVLRFLAGVGVGGMWPNGVALVSECWTSATRPMVAGIIGTGMNIGILCVSQLGRMRTVTADSWRWLVELGAVFAVIGLAAVTILPESPRWLATRGSRTTKTEVPLRELLRPPLLRITIIGILLGSIPLIGAWAASYFLISLGSVTLTCGIFLFSRPLDPLFLPLVFAQGFVTTLFFGWLPLSLPELFPTRVRATGTGLAYNTGRFASAAGVLGAGFLMAWSGGDYAKVGVITGLVYAFGMIVIWWAPDTTNKSLDD